MAFAVFWVFAFGLCLGSFLNVLVYRLPREEPFASGRSRCPHCRARIAAYDNVPLLSFLWLRGRCRSCGGRISWRYPALELCSGVLAALLWLRWGERPVWAAACAAAALGLLAVAVIDWDTFLIPDELSLGLLALGIALSPINALLSSPAAGAWWHPILLSLRGAAVGFAVCWGVAEIGELLFKKEAMGGGDVKLLAAIGAWSGGTGAFDALMLGSLLGAVYGVWLIARGRLTRSDPIPFGPFLSAAAVFNFFVLLPLGFPFITR